MVMCFGVHPHMTSITHTVPKNLKILNQIPALDCSVGYSDHRPAGITLPRDGDYYPPRLGGARPAAVIRLPALTAGHVLLKHPLWRRWQREPIVAQIMK